MNILMLTTLQWGLTLANQHCLKTILTRTLCSKIRRWRWKHWCKFIDRDALLRNLFCGKERAQIEGEQVKHCSCLMHLRLCLFCIAHASTALHLQYQLLLQHSDMAILLWQSREADGSSGVMAIWAALPGSGMPSRHHRRRHCGFTHTTTTTAPCYTQSYWTSDVHLHRRRYWCWHTGRSRSSWHRWGLGVTPKLGAPPQAVTGPPRKSHLRPTLK